jgi:WD40 repeat protein
MASCSADKKIKIYDLRCKRLIQNYDAHGESITKINFHPKNNNLISTSLDGKIKLWDIMKGELEYTVYGHNGGVNACSFSKYGDYFATGGADSIFMLWKTNLEPVQT